MRITKVSFSRKFNLGNFETLDVGMEAELSETDNPQDVLTVLKDNVEMWFIGEQRKAQKKPEPATVTPDPRSIAQQSTAMLQPQEQPQPTNQPKPSATQPQPQSAPQQPPKTEPAETVLNKFPEHLRKHLTVKDGKVITEFVSKERWQEMNSCAKELGYHWISADKDSRWEK